MSFLFGFSGRIGRGRWWLLGFINFLFWIGVIGAWTGTVNALDLYADQPGELSHGGLSLVIVILAAGVLGTWMNIAACARRFHDRGKSGWWFLINFVPLIGPVWLIVECGMLPGLPGANRFGPPPQGRTDDDGLLGELPQASRSGAARVAERAPQIRAAKAASPGTAPRRPANAGFGRRGLA